MSDPTWADISKKIDEGILNAQADYKRATWTPLLYGPEYLIIVSIFKSLLELASLSLEENPKALLEMYQEKPPRRGRPRIVPRDNGRVDICLWCKEKDRPRAIIEVKRCAEDWNNNTSDIIRLAKLLLKYRWLDFGVLASCLHKEIKNDNEIEAKRDIKRALSDLRKTIKANLDGRLSFTLVSCSPLELFLKKEYPEDNEVKDWYWQPVICKIHGKRRPCRCFTCSKARS